MKELDGQHREVMAERILHQGELKLAAQLQLATSADSRAATLTAIFSTVTIALLGGAGAIFFSQEPNLKLVFGLSISGIFYGVSAYLCALACQPTDFYTAGNQPEKWLKDNAMSKTLSDALLKEAQNYQVGIMANRLAIRQSAERLKWALRLSWASPFIGLFVVVFLALYQAAEVYLAAVP